MRPIILLLFVLLVCFQLMYITVINDYVPIDSEYAKIRERTEQLKKENMLLKEKLLREESLTTIDQKAKQAGFIPASWVYLHAKK